MIQPGTRAYRTVVVHMSLNLLVILAFGADFVWRYGSYHRPGAVPTGQIAASAASLALLAVSGYLGGKLSYRYGVRVADEQTQARGFTARRSVVTQSAPAGYAGPAAPAGYAGPAAPAGYVGPAAPAGYPTPAPAQGLGERGRVPPPATRRRR